MNRPTTTESYRALALAIASGKQRTSATGLDAPHHVRHRRQTPLGHSGQIAATREQLETALARAESELVRLVADIVNRTGNVAKARAYLPKARANYIKTLAALSRFNRADGKSVSYRTDAGTVSG